MNKKLGHLLEESYVDAMEVQLDLSYIFNHECL